MIEGLLLPRDNKIILNLLFELATWHAFAKLQVHTGVMLDLFEATTRSLTATMWQFLQETCETYMTQELPKETAACGQHTAALAGSGKGHTGKGKASTTMGAKCKKLNLATYKYHTLADYPETI